MGLGALVACFFIKAIFRKNTYDLSHIRGEDLPPCMTLYVTFWLERDM